MAEEKKEISAQGQKADAGTGKKNDRTVKPTMYSVGELLEKSEKLFGTKRECAVAALKPLGVDILDVETAKETVKKFMSQKVR